MRLTLVLWPVSTDADTSGVSKLSLLDTSTVVLTFVCSTSVLILLLFSTSSTSYSALLFSLSIIILIWESVFSLESDKEADIFVAILAGYICSMHPEE